MRWWLRSSSANSLRRWSLPTFVLAAEVLEGLTVGRGRRAIRDLLDFLPATATVRRNGAASAIPLSEIRVGDAVLVAPGECIAVDGTVRAVIRTSIRPRSRASPRPSRRRPDAIVYAGTINQTGTLEVVADRLGRDTSFGKIVEAVERAERSRAPIQKTADRYAGYLVYFALACAALTFALTRDARSTISVIIVAGACGIAAGTPLAVLGAIGRAAHERRDHQGRPLPRSAVDGRHGRVRQDRHGDHRRARNSSRSGRPTASPTGPSSKLPPLPSVAPSTRSPRRSCVPPTQADCRRWNPIPSNTRRVVASSLVRNGDDDPRRQSRVCGEPRAFA